jgi:hypothetical protein
MHPSRPAITDQEFALFQRLIHRLAGISLSDAKRVLLVGRLGRRLEHHGFTSYSEYYRLLASGDDPDEVQKMVDLLTTNETYFFREPQHFDFLRDLVRQESARAPPSASGAAPARAARKPTRWRWCSPSTACSGRGRCSAPTSA